MMSLSKKKAARSAGVPSSSCLLLLLLLWTTSNTCCFAWQLQSHRRATLTTLRTSNKDEGWSVADDWDALSNENPINSVPDSRDLFNQDVARNAAQTILPDNHGDDDHAELSEDDAWIRDAIEEIQNPLHVSDSPLYDTPSQMLGMAQGRKQRGKQLSKEEKQKAWEEQMGNEIAMLVRCNESPEDMLIKAGRAVRELTLEQKQDVAQLLVWNEEENDQAGHWEVTPFFQQAIQTMFEIHAEMNDDDDDAVPFMDAKAVSRWMMRSIGHEGESYTERASPKGKDMTSFHNSNNRQRVTINIGPHDSRVLKIISKYSEYGTGKLTLDNFQQVYVDALTHMPNGMALVGSVETLRLRNADHVRQVWRDLKNHGLIGPNEQEWNQKRDELQKKYGSVEQQTQLLLENGDFVDECEILDWGSYDTSTSPSTTTPTTSTEDEKEDQVYDAKNHKYIKKSSHEQVALAADQKTPLYMQDGSFVFIDEESCIGCMQVRFLCCVL
jgi:NAD-dependent dihydropyrimidine dehydrogenase PreA subunit